MHWWSAGAIVAAYLGDEYGVLATALGTIRHRGLDTPQADTLDGHLMRCRGTGTSSTPTGWRPPSPTSG